MEQTRTPINPFYGWWCNALFMAPSVIAKYANVNQEPVLKEKVYQHYKETYDLLYNQEEQLFTRYKSYLWTGSHEDIKENNGKRVFWSRGNGWVLGGLALLLEEL